MQGRSYQVLGHQGVKMRVLFCGDSLHTVLATKCCIICNCRYRIWRGWSHFLLPHIVHLKNRCTNRLGDYFTKSLPRECHFRQLHELCWIVVIWCQVDWIKLHETHALLVTSIQAESQLFPSACSQLNYVPYSGPQLCPIRNPVRCHMARPGNHWHVSIPRLV